jgi:uncharacterized protein (DUF1330 family)
MRKLMLMSAAGILVASVAVAQQLPQQQQLQGQQLQGQQQGQQGQQFLQPLQFHKIFVIQEQQIQDPIRYNNEYAPREQASVHNNGGRFYTRASNINNMQGDAGPQHLVIIGFNSLQQLQQWQQSPEYQALANLKAQGNVVKTISQYAVNTCAQQNQQLAQQNQQTQMQVGQVQPQIQPQTQAQSQWLDCPTN